MKGDTGDEQATFEKSRVLAYLRACGPAFDQELISEGLAADPDARIAQLVADGYHIETMKAYRNGGIAFGRRWLSLYVLRLKHPETGAVIAAPAPIGAAPMLEKW